MGQRAPLALTVDPAFFPQPRERVPPRQQGWDPTSPPVARPHTMPQGPERRLPDHLTLQHVPLLRQAHSWRVEDVDRWVASDGRVLYLLAATWDHDDEAV